MVKFAQNWLNLNQQIFKMVKNCSFGFQDIFFFLLCLFKNKSEEVKK